MNIFNSKTLFDEILLENPWRGTSLESYYYLNPASKGSFSEKFIKDFLLKRGFTISKRLNSGHDLICNGRKTELKFGLSTNRNYEWKTIFNHIGFDKDWEDIIFCCINGNGDVKMVLYDRDSIPKELLSKQQGGKSNGNNDFMINNKNSYSLLHNGGKIID